MKGVKEVFNFPNIKLILVTSFLLRIILMMFLYHPDIKTYHFQSQFLGKKVFNIYNYLDDKKSELPLKEEFVYQPLTYFFLGSYQIIAKPMLGQSFNSWLNDASQSAIEQNGIFRYLFILKLPYLILDFAIGFLLMSFFKTKENRSKIFTLWIINPVSAFFIYSFSNVDILVLFIMLLGLLSYKKGNKLLSVGFLTLATLFKVFPLLVVPFIIIEAESYKKALLLSLTSFAILVVGILPFVSKSFINAALISGLTTRLFLPSIDIGFGILVSIPIVLFVFFYFALRNSRYDLFVKIFILFSGLLSFIHYHIQWIVWLLPFALLTLIREKALRAYIIIFVVLLCLLPFLYNDKQMTVGLFSAITASASLIPIPYTILSKVVDPFQVQSFLQSTILGMYILILWKIYQLRKS